MKKRFLLFLLAALIPLCLLAGDDIPSRRFNTVTFTPVSPLSAFGGQGVSGAFVGTVPKNAATTSHSILVAGGCNFPDVPAAEGGQKVFYADIYAIALDEVSSHGTATSEVATSGSNSPTWKRIGSLPAALAYGASVTTPEGIVCLGGTTDGRHSERFAALLAFDKNGKFISRPLPPLPVSLDNFAAAFGDGYIYVAGGQHDGVPNHKAFRLKWPLPASWFDSQRGAGWEELPHLPGPARVQPTAAVQKGAVGSNFYLFGGYDPRTQKVATGGIYYDARKKNWCATSPMKESA